MFGKLIAHGVYGATYECGKDKVLKVVHIPTLPDGTDTEKVYKHYQALKKLNFDGFVKLYDVKYDGFYLFIEMERVDRMFGAKDMKLLPDVAKLIDKMQKANICHNDLHLGNVGVMKDGTIKFIDLDFTQIKQSNYCFDTMKFWITFIVMHN